jgi:hypothetical protein
MAQIRWSFMESSSGKELMDMKFEPCKADPDVWLRQHGKQTERSTTNTCLCAPTIFSVSVDPVERVMNPLIARGYREDVGPPTIPQRSDI